jgi:hypothetical protein
VYLLAYWAMVFVWAIHRTWKRTGIKPITVGKADTAHDYIGRVMKLPLTLSLLAVLCFAVGDRVYQWLVPIGYLRYSWLAWAGPLAMHLSSVWIMAT